MQDLPFSSRIIDCGDRDAWRKRRSKSIGGSDAPTLAGLNPFKLRDELWAEMTGLLEPVDISQEPAVYWGSRLEPVILDEVGREYGSPVSHWPQSSVVVHESCDRIHDTPDGIMRLDGLLALVQVKTVNAYKIDDWRDEPPVHVYTQVQHELEVTGLTVAVVAALIGGQQYKSFIVERDREVGDWLVDRAREFLAWVDDRIEPPHDSRFPMTVGLAKRIYTRPEKDTIPLDPGFVTLDARRAEIDQEVSVLEEERGQINERIRRAIGNASCGQLVNGVRYSISKNGAMRRVAAK